MHFLRIMRSLRFTKNFNVYLRPILIQCTEYRKWPYLYFFVKRSSKITDNEIILYYTGVTSQSILARAKKGKQPYDEQNNAMEQTGMYF